MQDRQVTERKINKIHQPLEVYVAYKGKAVAQSEFGIVINYNHIYKKYYLYKGPSTDLAAVRLAHCKELAKTGKIPIYDKTTVWGRVDETIKGYVHDRDIKAKRKVTVDQTRWTLLEGGL